MIGLPLRLLAREVYDKVAARVGSEAVALVTGEEKSSREPALLGLHGRGHAVDLDVDFLAIDEVQLGADHRGHVFTDRASSIARGREETWFLGAETMRPMVERSSRARKCLRVLGCPNSRSLARRSRARCRVAGSGRVLGRRSTRWLN